MRNLLDQIKQDIDNFVKDAEAHVAKAIKPLEHVPVRFLWKYPKNSRNSGKKSIDAAK